MAEAVTSTAAPTPLAELRLENIRTEVVDGVGYLRLNRPPANAHHLAMILELDRAVLAVRFDDDVRAVVLTSDLDRFFSAGADINVIRDEPPHRVGLLSQTSKEVIMRMRSIPKVFIAAINGHCMGGGLELAMACDLRFAAAGDSRYGMPEINLGVIPGEGGSQLLGRIAGLSKALDLMLEGGSFGVEEALELKVVDRVFPADRLAEETHAYARKLADGPVQAIGFTKIALTEGLEMPLHSGFAFERELQNALLRTEDSREGAAAYLEKRAPRFSGRVS
jgi:enoyl-CoA hydratase/carnithine racemase